MTDSNDRVVIVIPNWNGADMIGACLESLQKQSLQAKIIVVENGSTDNSADFIKSKFPRVTLLPFDDNAGFAGGVNRGIRHALEHKAEYVLLLNNDATADKDWVRTLVARADAELGLGIIASKILRDDKTTIDSTGEFYSIWGMPFPRGRNHKDKGQYDKSTAVFGASGGAVLLRSEMFEKIGLFDEDFFAYYEDVDLSFRAHMAGWQVNFEPDAKVYHRLSGTSGKLGDFARYQSAKNFLLLYARNMPNRLYWKYLPLFILQHCRMFLGAIAHNKLGAFFGGTWAALKLHRKTVQVRKQNLSNQTVATSHIDKLLTKSYPPKIPKL